MTYNRRMILQLVVASVLTMSVQSCSAPSYLSEKDLKAYLLDRDNGLSKEHVLKGNKSIVTYRPTDLLVLQEARGTTKVDSSTLARLQQKYQNHYYFILSLSKDNKEAEYQQQGMGQFSDLVQTLSFRMPEHVNMTTNSRDTIPVGDYIYPRTYGMSNASTLMFAFNKEKIKNTEWVQFNLKEFGLGIGNQNFRFKTSDLENTPRIKFEITKSIK